MAKRLYNDFHKVYKILGAHPVMRNLLTEFNINDDDFKNVVMFLTKNVTKILDVNLKTLYLSQTSDTLEADQDSPYARRVNTFEDLPTSILTADKTIYFVKNPLPGSFYQWSSISQTWAYLPDYTEMSPAEYLVYQVATGQMIWENDSGYYTLSLQSGRKIWSKILLLPPNVTIKGSLIRTSQLPTYTATVGDIYYVKGEDILDVLAVYYGFTSPQFIPPWDLVLSENNVKLTELLHFTLFHFVYISTDNFYENNIIDFFPSYDRDLMSESPKIKLFMSGLGKKLDQLEDYVSSLENIYDLDQCPEELLDYIGQNLGYEKEDFTLSNVSFRELLKNIIEIYKVKGTNYSFTFFFKFLGFSINLKEFYFNRDVMNPEAFPGADSFKVEYYLSTKNPLYDTSMNVPAPKLGSIKNITDWDIERIALNDNGCTNSVEYMTGRESYNNQQQKWHNSPWQYFKTNLIEYSLSPFLEKVNLTSSDNETIKKYVKFLSPTYLFTWININVLPWIESYQIQNEQLIMDINVTLGDPRPTPRPWPAYEPGVMGVPDHTPGTLFVKKTSSDDGFKGPYLDYEDVQTYFYIYGTKLLDKISVYPLSALDQSDSMGESILSFYDRGLEFYEIKNLNDSMIQRAKEFLRRHGIRFSDNVPFRLLRNPLSIYEQEKIFINNDYYGVLYFYDKTSDFYILKSNLTEYEKSFAKKFMNLIQVSGDTFTTEIANNMNLGGDDVVGTILRRDGTTVRQKDHPSYIADATHMMKKRLIYDNLGIFVNDISDSLTIYNFSSKSFPSLPDTMSPFKDQIYFDSNNALLNWSNSYGTKNYRIQLANDYNFESIVEEEIIPTTMYTTVSKLHNDIYYWRMKVENNNNFSKTLTLDKHTFEFYSNRIGKLTPDNKMIYPPTVAADKIFFLSMFEECYYDSDNLDQCGYKLIDTISDIDYDRIVDIFFYVGYNWSQWSQVLNFDLQATPFPYNGEMINKATKYIQPIYTFKDFIGAQTYDAVVINFTWPIDVNAETYELEVSKSPTFEFEERVALVTTVSPDFIMDYDKYTGQYYILTGTFHWRYRVRDINLGVYPTNPDGSAIWANTYSFTVYFPEYKDQL